MSKTSILQKYITCHDIKMEFEGITNIFEFKAIKDNHKITIKKSRIFESLFRRDNDPIKTRFFDKKIFFFRKHDIQIL